MDNIDRYLAELDDTEKNALARTAVYTAALLATQPDTAPRTLLAAVREELWYSLPQSQIVTGQWAEDGKNSIDAVNFWRNLLGAAPLAQMPSQSVPGVMEVAVLTGEAAEQAQRERAAALEAEDAYYAEEDALAFAEDEK